MIHVSYNNVSYIVETLWYLHPSLDSEDKVLELQATPLQLLHLLRIRRFPKLQNNTKFYEILLDVCEHDHFTCKLI